MHGQPTKEQEIKLQNNLDKIKHKLIVISGKGGVGKSTVSVNIAYGLALSGMTVGILDVDIHGPSLAKMLNIEGQNLTVNENGNPSPIKVHENLYAVSLASMLQSEDEPVIWRGPMKMGVIRQFMQDIEWPELDFLVVDCPPGTGDEPLSAVQILKNVEGSVVVTTPQDVALLDVRKSLKFSQQLNIPVLGIMVNMNGFKCPHCNELINIFEGEGVEKASKDFNADILGNIPLDKNIVVSGDKGRPYIFDFAKTEGGKVFNSAVQKILKKLNI
ncbi:MAG: ATP-binding protein [Candidatus Cloacimonadota bacterium]|nr:MAG: ATP-binding protein [Candidatus Cloacimonadota bacterium]